MKTLKKISVILILLTTLTGCKQTYETKNTETQPESRFSVDFAKKIGIDSFSGNITYEAKNVEIYPNYEFRIDFLEEFGIRRFSGDITYKAEKEIALEKDHRFIIDYGDYYCPEDGEMEDVTYFPVAGMGDTLDYAITSYSNGGFKLTVVASMYEESTYFDRYLYSNIMLIHPLHMPHDSVVCTNLRFEGHEYGIGFDFYDSRPCAGKIKVYRVDGNEKYLSKEMVEADEEKTVWEEYYPNGNVKSIKTITHNPEDADEYGFAAKPFVTNTEYFLADSVASYHTL